MYLAYRDCRIRGGREGDVFGIISTEGRSISGIAPRTHSRLFKWITCFPKDVIIFITSLLRIAQQSHRRREKDCQERSSYGLFGVFPALEKYFWQSFSRRLCDCCAIRSTRSCGRKERLYAFFPRSFPPFLKRGFSKTDVEYSLGM